MPYDRKGDYFEYVRDGRKSTRGNESIKEMAPVGSSAGAIYARKKKTGIFFLIKAGIELSLAESSVACFCQRVNHCQFP